MADSSLSFGDYSLEGETVLAAVRQAAEVCRRVQQSLAGAKQDKADKSPVTIADYASQAILCQRLGDAFPGDPIIAEEDAKGLRSGVDAAFLDRIVAELAAIGVEASGETVCDWIDRGNASGYADRFWTFDPIDGTKGFLRGDQYAISAALVVGGVIVLGAVGCPNLALPHLGFNEPGVITVATRGQGAFATDFAQTRVVPISVSDVTDVKNVRLCESVESGHSAHGVSGEIVTSLGIAADPVRIDSQAKYVAVATGAAEAYLRLPTRPGYREKIWDHAGGVIVVEEAGGAVTDIAGNPFDFRHGATLATNRGAVVSNGAVQDALVAEVRRHDFPD